MAQRINIIVAFWLVVWSAIAGGLRSPSFVASLNAPVSQSTNEPSGLLNGLLSYWSFDSASLTNDIVGTNHLTMTGTVPMVSGKIGNASSFTNGVGNYYSISLARSNPIKMTNRSEFTCSYWVYARLGNGAVGNIGFVRMENVGSGGWGVGFDDPKYIFITQTNNNWLYFKTETPGSPNYSLRTNWVMVTAVLNTNGIYIYTNSALCSSTLSANIIPSNPTYNFNIGAAGGFATRAFSGMIDEPAIWNRALTTNEIQTLYNSGAGKQYPFN